MSKPSASFRPLKVGSNYAVAFSADSRFLGVVSRSVHIWDIAARKKVLTAHPLKHPSALCFSPDGSRLAVKSTSGQIVVVSTVDGANIIDFDNANDGEGPGPAFSACGGFIVDASWSGSLTVRYASTGRVEFTAAFPGEMIRSIQHDAKGETWIAEHARRWQPGWPEDRPLPPGYFSRWQWPFASRQFETIELELKAVDWAMSADARHLAIAHGGPTPYDLSIFDTVTGEMPSRPRAVTYGGTQARLAWSPNGAYIGSVHADAVVIYDSALRAEKGRYALASACDVSFSPNGEFVALGSWKGGVVLSAADMLS